MEVSEGRRVKVDDKAIVPRAPAGSASGDWKQKPKHSAASQVSLPADAPEVGSGGGGKP